MPARRPLRLLDIVLSRPVGAIAAGVTVSIFLGCLSLSFDKRFDTEHVSQDGIVTHCGEVQIPPNEKVVVYYPAPFASIPNLEVSETFYRCVVVEQFENRFIVCNKSPFSITAEWKARGPRSAPPAELPVAAPPSSTLLPAPEHSPELDKLPPPQPVPVKP